MKTQSRFQNFTRFTAIAAALMTMTLVSGSQGAEETGTTSPKARVTPTVVAAYFHRTVRCPTCQKIGDSIERSLRTGMAGELRDGRLRFMLMDLQKPENQRFVSTFKITSPTLVFMQVQEGRVVGWKPAPMVWSLIGDPQAFSSYVQGEARALLAGQSTESSVTRAR